MIFIKICFFTIGVMLSLSSFAEKMSATPLPDDDNRDYWLPQQVNKPGVLEQFQHTVSTSSVPFKQTLESPIRIALIYPSSDISDFWVRNYIALTKRLNELKIPFITEEFSSRQIEHSLQSSHTNEVIRRANEFDYVIFGPSELDVQADNIERLSATKPFHTLIWAFHTPKKEWKDTPTAWFDFSSTMGAQALCKYLIENLGSDVQFALNRGIPGITDDQRSKDFSNCVEDNGHWLNIYEHFGQYQKKGGFDGAELVTKNFPETQVLHNANTAMAMGAVEAIEKSGGNPNLHITGWGGTAIELEKIKEGSLSATPMRMGDDVGVATAEAIKFILEGREAEVPRAYLGRITVVSGSMSQEQIDKLSAEAFRYSGE